MTGDFRWRVCVAAWVTIGDKAGTIAENGYVQITIDGVTHKAHRLAFLYLEGSIPVQVDHTNHIRACNCWCNLQPATAQTNQKNRKLNKNNTSGFTGVHWCKAERKWRASIKISKRKLHLGNFKQLAEAIKCRKEANIKHGFHVNHGLQINN